MRKMLIGLMLAVCGGVAGLAQTNFYTNVTNLWYQGYKSNVHAIANVRLAANSNDIAGLILKAEYHLAFCERAQLSNAYLRVIQRADTITTTNFAKCWQEGGGRQDYFDILEYIAARARGAIATPEALKRPRDPLYSSVTKNEERNGVQSRDRRRA